jgi:predicted nucleotidyltransferase
VNTLEIEQRTLLLGLSGSRAYGLALADSDWEYKGICIPTLKDYISPTANFVQKDKWEQDFQHLIPELNNSPDSCIYSLVRYIQLALKCNPNILELLWLKRDQYVCLSPTIAPLLEIRAAFFSRKVKKAYLGYAISQIRRVKGHRKWLLKAAENPDFYTSPPKLEDYGLETNPLSKQELHSFYDFLYTLIRDAYEYYDIAELIKEKLDAKGVLKSHGIPEELLAQVQTYTRASNDFMTLLNQTHQYNRDLKDYHDYHAWLKNRNPKRAEIESKSGYDGKHLSHCLRLLHTGLEILEHQTLIVDRQEAGDADFLLQVKQGLVPYEEIIAIVEAKHDQLSNADWSKLPPQPDRELILETVEQITLAYLKQALA